MVLFIIIIRMTKPCQTIDCNFI